MKPRCHTCPDGRASVEMFMGSTRRGKSIWVCQECARMFERLARMLGGSPTRNPLLRVVK